MSAATLQQIAEHAQSWSEEDRRELVEHARSIEARRNGKYAVTADERAAILEGLAQTERGEFVTDAELSAAQVRYRG